MQRVNFFLSIESVKFLESLPGTISEHVRRAIDEYIVSKRQIKVSASASKRKEGE